MRGLICIGPYGNIYAAGFGLSEDPSVLVRSYSPDGATMYAEWYVFKCYAGDPSEL